MSRHLVLKILWRIFLQQKTGKASLFQSISVRRSRATKKTMSSSKYDRQLRLWGAKGQEALREAHVLLVGANAAGTETLKNLVLPGVGEFTIVDGGVVSEADIRSNFFVRVEDLGKSRAEVCAELLGSLNPDVKSHSVVSAPSTDLLNSNSYSLVIVCEADPEVIEAFAASCWSSGTPLIVAGTAGLVGRVRVQLRDLEIVESKPDNVRWDLRINEPFEELQELFENVEATVLKNKDATSGDLSHVPYALILMSAVQDWRAQKNGTLPSTFAEKNEVKEVIKAKAARFPNVLGAENFQEALAEAYRSWSDARKLPDDAMDALEKSKSKKSSPLVLTLRAIQDFSEENNGLPPLAGAVPDMHSDTTTFIALQRAFAAKAKKDLEAVKAKVPGVDPDFVELVCRHLGDVKFFTNINIESELTSPIPFESYELVPPQEEDAQDKAERMPRLAYLAYRANDAFFKKHRRWPSETNDAAVLKAELSALFPEPALDAEYTAWATEFVRGATCDLHSIAAVVGGVASQEAVKAIARQFTPLKDVFIFDGLSGAAGVLPLG